MSRKIERATSTPEQLDAAIAAARGLRYTYCVDAGMPEGVENFAAKVAPHIAIAALSREVQVYGDVITKRNAELRQARKLITDLTKAAQAVVDATPTELFPEVS